MVVAGCFYIVASRLSPIMAATGCQVDFTSNNRFDPVLLCLGEKLDGTEHVSMVGHLNFLQTLFFHGFDQGSDFVRPVEHAVLRMDMQVDKAHNRHHLPAAAHAYVAAVVIVAQKAESRMNLVATVILSKAYLSTAAQLRAVDRPDQLVHRV